MGQSCVGRVAIVTGASRGIGQAIAFRLAAEGAKVAVVGRTVAPGDSVIAGSLAETVAMIREIGGSALAVPADLSDPAFDRGTIIKQTADAFGAAPDILVNNAAATREFGRLNQIPFAETPREWFFRSVEVNVWAAWEIIELMVPGMRARGAGWVLTITSAQAAPRPKPTAGEPGRYTLAGACIYGGTKAMLDRITTGAAQELYDDNIAVNALAPTRGIVTPHLVHAILTGPPPENAEPLETMVEAALALCTGDPKTLTSRVTNSLTLLAELDRPVYTLDGKSLVEGLQPRAIDPGTVRPPYLAAFGH